MSKHYIIVLIILGLMLFIEFSTSYNGINYNHQRDLEFVEKYNLASPTPQIFQGDITGFTSVERNLFMKIQTFTIGTDGLVRIAVDVVLNGNVDKDIDLSNITMNFKSSDGKPIINMPKSTATKFRMHPPQILTMELQYYGVGKGTEYAFKYSYSSETISLGTFR